MAMVQKNKAAWWCVALGIGVFGVDRLSKLAVLTFLHPYDVIYTMFLDIYLMWNPGVSWGIFNQLHSGMQTWLLMAGIVSMFTIFFIVTIKNFRRGHMPWLESMILGGGLSNIVDRLWYGAVIDFMDLHIAGIHWPTIFNIADLFIVAGVIGIVIRDVVLSKRV